MAESMKGLHRSHRCTEVSNKNIGETVTLMGWVQKNRNKGGIMFVDLRDRSGIIQLIFENGSIDEEGFEKAAKLRSEFVIAVTGVVEARSGAVNTNMATGDIEVRVNSLRVLSESETPPFPIEENCKTKDEVRLKYRYLDLRRPDIQKNMIMRSQVTTLTRQFLAEEGFLEIETPILCKSTPEGARDYLVPSRVHPGSFYALPQSPQIFKQLLMCSGYDRYFQIAKCFRDEDLRADRQPEFTQIDMELSFVDVDDVIDVNERLLAHVFGKILGEEVKLPIQRMTWHEAMNKYGSDKPDLRFGMELVDVSETVAGCEFAVFAGALANGGSVRGLNVKGQQFCFRKVCIISQTIFRQHFDINIMDSDRIFCGALLVIIYRPIIRWCTGRRRIIKADYRSVIQLSLLQALFHCFSRVDFNFHFKPPDIKSNISNNSQQQK